MGVGLVGQGGSSGDDGKKSEEAAPKDRGGRKPGAIAQRAVS